MAESKFGFEIGEEVCAKEYSDPPVYHAIVEQFDNDDEPIKVRWQEGPDKGDTWWCQVSNVSKLTPPKPAPFPFQYRLDADGTPFTRKTGVWKGATLTEHELSISVPPCAHYQRVLLRVPPVHSENDIITELRRVAGDSGETITRGRLTSILNGEF